MSTPSAEQQLLDQIQHYPDTEYMDRNGHTHRCYTVSYNDDLYYMTVDPLNRGRRRPSPGHNIFPNSSNIPPITQAQLCQLTSAIPFANIKALFKPALFGISNAMCMYYDSCAELLLYALFVSNMRAHKPAACAPRTFTMPDDYIRQIHINEIITEQLFWFKKSPMNYAQLILENPVYAYCDTRLLSYDGDCIAVDRAGTHHVARIALRFEWACRYVPLDKQTAFSERGRIPCHGHYEENKYVEIITCSHGGYDAYRVNSPIVSWMIERGMVFYAHNAKYISVCKECYKSGHCIRTRAGEPYTCAEISRSYFWQYRVLTTFGPAEHERYVQVCKMIYE